MSEQTAIRRPLLLASAGLVTATVIYLAVSTYISKPPVTTGLQRRNAVRRPRHAQRNHAAQEVSTDPTVQAIRNLNARITSRQPYGRYENDILFELDPEALEEGRYDLIPQNLGPMFQELSGARDFTEHDKSILNYHIESIFIQNFLAEEFPAGYIIGNNVENIVQALGSHGITEDTVRIMVDRFDDGRALIPVALGLRDDTQSTTRPRPTDSTAEEAAPWHAIEALGGMANDESSVSGWGIDDDDESDPGGSQGMLDLLYHIAGEQAKREGLIHRGVECNNCGVVPIRGIRYHCANCFDFDLCETCEAQQVHHKNHVFYKIRIPAPSRGQIKQVSPVWYPGKPNAFPQSLPKGLSKNLLELHKMEKTELDSLFEQFKCLAGQQMSTETDPTHLGTAISRKNFDLYFTTTSEDRPPPQNLLYDRIFSFYDLNKDNLITFDEFVSGMVRLQNRCRAARVKRMFAGYDLDGDGYVSRQDFLRMLRAYYAWHKEWNREMIQNQDELDDDLREAVHSSQPISSAFGWHEFAYHMSRGGQDKTMNINGDLEVSTGPSGVLQNDSTPRGDRLRSIGNAAVYGRTRAHAFRSFRQEPEDDEPVLFLPTPDMDQTIIHSDDATDEELTGSDPRNHVYGWPPVMLPHRDDVVRAIGADIPLEEIMDPVDRARVIYAHSQRMDEAADGLLTDIRQSAIRQRWRRRRFYLDEEEGMSKPPGYTEPDSSDDEKLSDVDDVDQNSAPEAAIGSRRQSMRSRSSSKVRFDDSAIDTDYETRSNTSSRSIPLNERWGGFELSEPERDIGKDILYQAVQAGFNELLDPLFKGKEDVAFEAMATQASRQKWRAELDALRRSLTKDGAQDPVEPAETTSLIDALADSKPQELTTHPKHEDVDEAELVQENPQIHSDSSQQISADQNLDATLPQNRPNDEYTAALLADISASNHDLDSNEPPSQAIMTTWLAHDAIDQEAKVRGGYGRLSFREFVRKMVAESISHANSSTDASFEANAELWASTADLGRLSFLGSWLEMAQF